MILVAPTEPRALKAIGKSSALPERFGVDVLWTAHGVKWGVQRKEWKDLIASVEDGRLGREVQQMRGPGVSVPWLLVEGWPRVGASGVLVDKRFGRAWSERSLHGVLWSVMAEGVRVDRTADVPGTVEWVQWMVAWSRKDKHASLAIRPGPEGEMWGYKGNRDWGVHLLQGLPGVGVEMAGRIWDRFGRVPWRWEVGLGELTGIEGIGKKRAERMLAAFNGEGDKT